MHKNRNKFKVGDFIYFFNHASDLYILKAINITDTDVFVERITPDLQEFDELVTKYSHQSMGMIDGKTISKDEIPFLMTLFKK